jgi:putative ABC transport system permease protein
MMTASRSENRQMFWRIVRRLLGANRTRLFAILLALGAGAAVTAALLNLQIDAKRRLTTEFRAFGANVLVTPRDVSQSLDSDKSFDGSVLQRIQENSDANRVLFSGFLYAVLYVSVSPNNASLQSSPWTSTVLAGYSTDKYRALLPSLSLEVSQPTGGDVPLCYVGSSVAKRLNIHARDSLFIATVKVAEEPDPSTHALCFVQAVDSYGGSDDDQIFVNLSVVQRLTQRPNRLSLAQLGVPGTPREIEQYVSRLQQSLPEADVRPIRQFTEGEAKIYSRISSLLTATVVIVLLLTSLCVMAAMTNVAMERRTDVGLMKAIGGATRRVLRLFLAEAALLGFAGGVIGAAAGIFLSIWLGKQVFGVAAQPRLIVYPVAVVLTMIVAILSAYPLRRLASIRPASIFRGEA